MKQIFTVEQLKCEWKNYCEWVHPYDKISREKLMNNKDIEYHWMMAFQTGYYKGNN